MLKHSIKALSVGAALVLATSGAWAQTGNTTTTTPSTTIGVTPQEAREAAQKAVPNANTGTLVRTEPSAADRASEMAKDAKDVVTPDTRNTPDTTANGTAGSSMDSNMDNTNNTRSNMRNNNRPARADRN